MKVFDIKPTHPMGTTPLPIYSLLQSPHEDNRSIQLWVNVTPVHAQEFRAEFVRHDIGSRVAELDGFDQFCPYVEHP